MTANKEMINGSRTSFGGRTYEKNAQSEAGELIRHIVVDLVTDDDPTNVADLLVADSTDATVGVIPAHAFIFDCYINVKTAFTATTATGIDVGSETDPNGLVAVGGVGAKAALTANSWQQGDGALVGATWGAADESIEASWNVADATAVGEAKLIVMYIPSL